MSQHPNPPTSTGLSADKRELVTRLLKQRGLREHGEERIPRRGGTGPCPLSFGQERLWFFDQLEPGTPAYNLPDCYHLEGDLDIAALEESLTEIVRRHEALRTRFRVNDGRATQVVDAVAPVRIPVVEFPGDPGDDELERRAAEEARRPFDLTDGPLFRTVLLRRNPTQHSLVCTMHHAVFDGWSRGIFQHELAALYTARRAATGPSLPELSLQYGDFAVWQRERLQGELLEQQLAYWKAQLGGGLPILELPGDRPRSGLVSPEGAEESFGIPAPLAQSLRNMSRSHNVTPFVTLLALFQVLLHRYAGLDDIVTGTPIANRNRAELEHLIGFFVNTIALRTDFSDNPPFAELLRRVSETTLGAQAHQELPFERLVEDLHPERHLNHHPVFQVMFDWQSAPTRTLQLPGLTMRPWRIDPEVARFDLTLSFQEGEQGLRGWLEYNSSLFDRTTIRRMADHFGVLAQAAVTNPSQRVAQLPILPAAERHQVLVEWNDTAGEFPRDRCVHEIFEERAAERPDAVAVVAPDGELTYRALNERANRLARYLRQHGVSTGSLVGMFVEKSINMVVAVLGILKAGGAYVPLDPRYPADRMAFVLDDTKAPALLTQEHLLDRLPDFAGVTVCLDRDWGAIAQEDAADVAASARPDDLLYIIYTSGSTGVPKGVEIHHRAFVNLSTTLNEWWGLEADDRMLQLSSIAFDTGSEELLSILLRGGGSVLFPVEMIGSFDRFCAFVEEHRITVLDLPTAFWHEWVGALEHGAPFPSTVRLVAAGGEAAMPGAFRAWRRCVSTGVRWQNSYGPTETTVTCSLWEAGAEDGERLNSVPIGKPLLNSPLYVLDRHLQPVPVGIPGDLYIGGELVGRGYLNRPQLTAERFVPDPFHDTPGSRMYRSGDVCRWLPEGHIEFFGRRDHQIKIRGFRIELGEIEAVLGDHPEILQAVAVVHTGRDGHKRIVAYIVSQTHPSVDVASIRDYLRERIPEYMIPAHCVQLESFPMTTTRKVDRKALPDPGEIDRAPDTEVVAPRTDVERFLADCWRDVLGVDGVGVFDDFFDVGGHSLLATRVISRIRQRFEIELELRRLFEAPTIAQLADSIEAQLISDIEALSEEEAERLLATDLADG